MGGVGVAFSRFLQVPFEVGVGIGMVIVAFFAVLGGMKGITYTQVAQYCVLIVAYTIPAVAIALALFGNPIPQLAIGEALPLLDGLQQDLGLDAYSSPFVNNDLLNVVCITLCLMVGTAGLPHVIVRFYTVKSVRAARWSAFWALLFIALLYTTAPALAIFAKTAILQQYGALGPAGFLEQAWVQNWAQTGLIDTAAIAGSTDVTQFLGAINRDIIVLATPEIAGLGPFIVALVAAGGLAAALSTASGLLLVISSSLAHDIYGQMINPAASDRKRLAVGRAMILVAVVFAGLLGIFPLGFVAEVVAFAFGLAAACVLPGDRARHLLETGQQAGRHRGHGGGPRVHLHHDRAHARRPRAGPGRAARGQLSGHQGAGHRRGGDAAQLRAARRREPRHRAAAAAHPAPRRADPLPARDDGGRTRRLMTASRAGCSRHLILIGVLLAAALAVLLARHPGRALRVWDDAQAMREGADEAREMASPDDLLAWIAAHPEQASLVVVDGRGDALLAHEPDRPRPVAALPVLWTVATWAQNPRVRPVGGNPADSAFSAALLDAYRLTGGPYAPAASPPLPADSLVTRAVRGDPVAASALLGALGPARVAELANRYGSEVPLPFGGLLLAWADGDRSGASAPLLSRRLAEDALFRTDRRAHFASGDAALSLREQRAAAAASFPEGTASAYAQLLADALAGPALSHEADLSREVALPREAAGRFLRATEIPSRGPLRVGAQGGGFPGHLAFAAWAESPHGPGTRAAVLILSDLPIGLFYHLSRTGLDAALVLGLVTSDTLAAE